MAISRESIVFDVHDCQVWPLLSDVAGAAASYGDPVNVFGIAQISFDPNLVTAELKGDARVIAKRGRLDRVNFSATYGKLSLDVLEVLLSTTVISDGTTPNEIVSGYVKGGVALPSFRVAAQLQDVDLGLGAINLVIPKAQITGGTLVGTQSDQFGQPTFDAEGIALEGLYDGESDVIAIMQFLETQDDLENLSLNPT